ncbi:hypothetical protein [Methanobrevibacter millerae]|uniref:Uncharacterized protein n=1 Tax=Methanobrevibacter millerae TaxID=230361 RepID=A0A1G5XLF6_9EURY|nr:hypothetical protein [Methanobrevibacter millerae]SDA71010.1 hypothetical protein SAMN02910315_02339 [Methanobrevibacter millerae]
MQEEEYYIEDNDLVDLLKDVLGDKISDEDIERILSASEDGEITEDDFDRIVDEILAKSKTTEVFKDPEPIIPDKTPNNKGFLYLSTTPDKCPVCGSALIDDFYCANCNLKFSFVKDEGQNPSKK